MKLAIAARPAWLSRAKGDTPQPRWLREAAGCLPAARRRIGRAASASWSRSGWLRASKGIAYIVA